MKLYRHNSFSIFFGDAQERCDPSLYRSYTSTRLGHHFPFNQIQQTLKAPELFFLHQVHGTAGMIIQNNHSNNGFISFTIDGDYLITQNAYSALGIVTADCLPLVFYDKNNKVTALVHAGWRGSVAGIVATVFDTMKNAFGTNFSDIAAFFGPSACICCYRVDEEFIEPLRRSSGFDRFIQKRNNDYFFDLPLYNELILLQLGVLPKSINRDYNQCTICNDRFCSYRRESMSPFRNVTVVVLH